MKNFDQKLLNILLLLIFSVIAIGMIYAPKLVSASGLIRLKGTATVANTGEKLYFEDYNSSVMVDYSTGGLSGYCWSADLGWIDFSNNGQPDSVAINLATGAVTGKAYVINTNAYIDFGNYNSNVIVSLGTGIVSGYAWSEDLGWIDFSDSLVYGSLLRSNPLQPTPEPEPEPEPTPEPEPEPSPEPDTDDTDDDSTNDNTPPPSEYPEEEPPEPQGLLMKINNQVTDVATDILTSQITPPVTVSIAGISTIGVSSYVAGFAFTDIPAYLRYLGIWILNLFGLAKKRKKLGVVYDSITKNPISLAVVRLFKAGKLIGTTVSDNTGVFSFEAPQGTYTLQVVKTRYTFPSKIVKGSTDGALTNVYRGGEVMISQDKILLSLNIPLDPAEPSKFQATLRKITSAVSSFVAEINMFLLTIALVVSAGAYLLNPVLTNLNLMLLNIALVVLNIYIQLKSIRYWGIVRDTQNMPVADVRIALYDKEFNNLIAERFTDSLGRYSFIVTPGHYILKVDDAKYELTYGSDGIPIEALGKGSYVINERLMVRNKTLL